GLRWLCSSSALPALPLPEVILHGPRFWLCLVWRIPPYHQPAPGLRRARSNYLLRISKGSGSSSSTHWGRKQITCATLQTLPRLRPQTLYSAFSESSLQRACFSKPALIPIGARIG